MLIEFDTKNKSWHNNTTAPSAYPKKIGSWTWGADAKIFYKQQAREMGNNFWQ